MQKILVVDDEILARETIAQILKMSGYEIVSARNGRLGLKLFESEQPDLVITDIIMPERDGIETIVELRRLRPGVKIIAISGGGRTRDANYLKIAESLGACAILSKPFTAKELLSCVETCFATG
jgi:YesN/AraC family two-component response regulator